MVLAITEIINNMINIIANHLAMVKDAPEINPNPNIPAIIDIIKNNMAQIIHPLKPFLFMFPPTRLI